jgi:hypothetical protein
MNKKGYRNVNLARPQLRGEVRIPETEKMVEELAL